MHIDLPSNREAAVVLLSGGLDSCVALAAAISVSSHVRAVMVRYGQTHDPREVAAAHYIADFYRIPRSLFLMDLSQLDSALVKNTFNRSLYTRASAEEHLPPSFVPGRNLIFTSLAAGVAYGSHAQYVYGGWNAIDFSGYPDCRPKFLQTMETAIQEGISETIELVAPLVMLSKAAIIRWGLELKAPLHLTWSCYAGGDKPCGECDSCQIRAKGFSEVGVADPAL